MNKKLFSTYVIMLDPTSVPLYFGTHYDLNDIEKTKRFIDKHAINKSKIKKRMIVIADCLEMMAKINDAVNNKISVKTVTKECLKLAKMINKSKKKLDK